MKFVYFCIAALFVGSCSAQNLQGNWQASVQEHGLPMRYELRISKSDRGVTATLDAPDNFVLDNPVDAITLENSTLHFRAGSISYDGSLAPDSQTIEGTWSVGLEKQTVNWQRSASQVGKLEAVATQLGHLSSLPAEKWKIHAGDIPHGESTDLDDSSWNEVGPGTTGPYDAVWYRRWIEIPKNLNGYDLTGARIWFDFQYDANGPVTEILYFNGRRIAMGDELEPVVLFDNARVGDRILVAVKLLHSVDQKRFQGARLRIEYPDSRPNPTKLFQELGAVSILAPVSPDSRQLKTGLAESANAVDLNALARADQPAFDKSLNSATSVLETLKPDLQKSSIWMVGNSHIDAAWLWPWTETVDVVRRTFGTTLQLMDEYPQATYAQSAAAYSEWIVQKYPSMYQQIRERVKQGRWEMVGGMWVEPDLNMPDGESLVRQLLIGKRYFKDKFGVDVRIGWNPDSFGYNWQLPQIYKRSGVDYFVTQKMTWNDSNQLPLKVFWWQSPDGSRVLTYFPHDYVNQVEPLGMARDLATAEALNPGAHEMMHLYGIGDHGGGVTRAMLDSGMRWSNPDAIFPKANFAVAQGFFSDIEGKADTKHAPVWNYKTLATGNSQLPNPPAGKFGLPVWNDELYFEYHRGVFTSQAQHKRNMRESEEQMLNAEKLASLAWLSGDAYPNTELTEAWKEVLFNQFHDLAAGSGIGVIYRDAQRDYDDVRLVTDHVSSDARHTLEQQIDTHPRDGGVPVLVMNPLAWDRTDLVSVDVQLPEAHSGPIAVMDSEGKPQLFQVLSKKPTLNTYELLVEAKDVPSLGYRMLYVIPGERAAATDLKANGLTLENAALKLSVDAKSGCISSLYNKRSKFEFIAPNGCGNELIAFKDTPKDYDAWNIDSDFDKVFTKLDSADSVELIEKGPLRATIRVVHTWQQSKFVQDISLYAGLDRVDVHNEVDWHETHILLKAAFPLAASSDEATYEIPYGTIERPTTRNNRFEAAKFEVPALRWADLGDQNHGLSLINESKYGYDAKENVLRLSLLRASTWPDPDADRGRQSFSYSIYPHTGTWKQALTVRRGYDFNYKLSAVQVQPHSGALQPSHSFVGVKQDNVVLTALKKAEDSDALLLRVYEWAGKSGNVQVKVPDGARAAYLTNLMEQPEGEPLVVSPSSEISFPVHPYEIVSLRIDYARKSSARRDNYSVDDSPAQKGTR
jgi:alpha-mannosidase